MCGQMALVIEHVRLSTRHCESAKCGGVPARADDVGVVYEVKGESGSILRSGMWTAAIIPVCDSF
jgi:hypothetical protein